MAQVLRFHAVKGLHSSSVTSCHSRKGNNHCGRSWAPREVPVAPRRGRAGEDRCPRDLRVGPVLYRRLPSSGVFHKARRSLRLWASSARELPQAVCRIPTSPFWILLASIESRLSACSRFRNLHGQPLVLDTKVDPLVNQTFEPLVGHGLTAHLLYVFLADVLRAAFHLTGIADLPVRRRCGVGDPCIGGSANPDASDRSPVVRSVAPDPTSAKVEIHSPGSFPVLVQAKRGAHQGPLAGE